ncbi:PREDICTED: uncharacterized protein LOC108560189 [Nicrophorus vespilloides]|uniref:Uncharacterized protein LOC108560189 n=1 Tax=Nicrophorus vespilloides TaxID=110193 RepID=A0ABM1MEY0_NICVS|nr:PREDICTED: uncharacterized protein LOC108560189 [Nicrophorus vespilloides]
MFKLLCVALLPLALASAEYLYGDVSDGYTYNTAYASAYDNYKPRDYKVEYGVSDPHTGDHKSQWEVKENGVVRGAYSLLEADGTTRIVEYYADDTGFHADVKKIGTAVHAQQEHQIQLAPIVKNQIIDSIAYNGYGHGGLEHGYGAPIETIHHEALPVAKEVVVEAPVQKIEQIIEPQLEQVLHQEAPLSVEKFAPIAPAQYIKEIAPQSFNPIYEQIAKYAPVPQFYEPKIESYYPAPAAKVLSYPQQAYYQTPVANYEAYPVHTKVEEAYYPQSPIQQYYQAPIAKVAPVAKVLVPEVHVSKVQAYAPYQEQAKVAAFPVSHSQIPYYEQAKVALPAIQVSKVQAYAPYYEQAKFEVIPVSHSQPQYYEQAKVVAQNQAQYYEQPKLQAYYLPQVAKVEKPIYYEQQPQQQHLVKSEIPQSFILGELAKIAPHIEPKYKDAVTYAQPAYHSYHPEY